MLTIEDVIESLQSVCFTLDEDGNHFIKSPFDRKFLNGVSEYTLEDKPLSTNQSRVAVKIARKYPALAATSIKNTQENITEDDVLELCCNPRYRNKIYVSTIRPREIRYIGKRKIAFSSKRADEVLNIIKAISDPYKIVGADSPYFVYKQLIWVVEVTENTIDKIYTAIKKLKFSGNLELVEFFEKCEESRTKYSNTKIIDDHIELEINNDEFVAAWFDQLLEIDINVRKSKVAETSSDS